MTPEHIDALRRIVSFLREWDTPANNADADLIAEVADHVEREEGLDNS